MLKQKMCKNLTQDVPQKDPGPPTAGLQITNADFIFLFFFFKTSLILQFPVKKKNLSRLGFQKKSYILYTSTSFS